VLEVVVVHQLHFLGPRLEGVGATPEVDAVDAELHELLFEELESKLSILVGDLILEHEGVVLEDDVVVVHLVNLQTKVGTDSVVGKKLVVEVQIALKGTIDLVSSSFLGMGGHLPVVKIVWLFSLLLGLAVIYLYALIVDNVDGELSALNHQVVTNKSQ